MSKRVPRLAIDERLLALLRKRRASRPADADDPVITKHDAFMLDPGLGPAVYLTSAGRVLIDEAAWEPGGALREATEAEAWQAIVAGARKMEIPELLELLPEMPKHARPCSSCSGTHFAPAPGATDESGTWVCHACGGMGWTRPVRRSNRVDLVMGVALLLAAFAFVYIVVTYAHQQLAM